MCGTPRCATSRPRGSTRCASVRAIEGLRLVLVVFVAFVRSLGRHFSATDDIAKLFAELVAVDALARLAELPAQPGLLVGEPAGHARQALAEHRATSRVQLCPG